MAGVAGMSRGSFLGASVLALLSACATAPSASAEVPAGTLNRAALRASQPRSITLDKTHIAAFDGSTHSVVIPGGGLLGAAVGETLSEDHSAMLGEYQLEDPVAAIRTAILARLVRRFGLSVVSEAEASGEVGAPVATDLSLAIDTESWGIIRTRASHYGVKYRGSLRLTDNRTHQVIAEGACASRPVDSDDTPTIDELRANEGALLKTLLAATAEYCIDDYRKRVLGLY